MTDIATFIKQSYKKEPSKELQKLINDQEKATQKPYVINISDTGIYTSITPISSDQEKHIITIPIGMLNKIHRSSVAEALIAHEILHTKLEMEGFKHRPFNKEWENMLYGIIVDLIINQRVFPEYSLSFKACACYLNLKLFDVDSKGGFNVPSYGDEYIKLLTRIGELITSMPYWSLQDTKVKKIKKVLHTIYKDKPLGRVYNLMNDHFENICNISTYQEAYTKTAFLIKEIETIISAKS